MASESPRGTAGKIAAVLLPLCQNIQGKVFQIHEIDQMPLPLDLQKAFTILCRQSGECHERLPRTVHHGQDPVRGLAAGGRLQFEDPFLLRIPHGLDGFLEAGIDIVIFFAPDRGVAGKFPPQRTLDLLPEFLIKRNILSAAACRRILQRFLKFSPQFSDLSDQTPALVFQESIAHIRAPGL